MYYVVYTYDDNYVCEFDDIKSLTNVFNISINKLNYIIKHHNCLVLGNKKYKIYAYPIFKERNLVRRR